MRTLFGMSRYMVYIAVLGLLLAALAVFVFAGISTVSIVIESFGHGEFNAEGARALSIEVIEMIDLFLLGTVLLITSLGLYELFLDSSISQVIPEWLSVTNLEQLKFNLLAVIVVMLAILFLGAIAEMAPEHINILHFGIAIAAVLASIAVVVWVFAHITGAMEAHKHEALAESESHAETHATAHD